MGKLVSFCIKHRVTTIMACVMVLIFGITGFNSLPLSLMPSMDMNYALVMTTYSTAAPAEVENLVTKTIEAGCASVSGLSTMTSVSSEGSSLVVLEFDDGTNMDTALVDLRESIDMVESYLPDDAGSPIIMQLDPDSMPVAVIGLQGDDLVALQAMADDTVSPQLERINGVASVDVMGGYETEIAVETKADQVAGYGLSVSYIAQILMADNISLPVGSVSSGSSTLSVSSNGEFASVTDVANSLIALPTGGSVRLGEIADVFEQYTDQTTVAVVNGQPSVLLSVNKQSSVNTVEVASSVLETMEELALENPDLQYSVVMDQSDYINLSVDATIQNIVVGVVLAALVLLVFLRSIGATAVISFSMPLCIVGVFLVMQVMGITMNMMSLGGMAMGVGMIVDNSIVVLENIVRYRGDGYNRYDACVQGTGEVAMSIIASTLTTMAVFLPIGLSSGIVGMLFYDFSVTICILMAMSLIVALTIVPLLSYFMLGGGSAKQKTPEQEAKAQRLAEKRMNGITMRFYKKVLSLFITKRFVAVLVSFAMMAGFTTLIFTSGFEMIPEMDQSMVAVTVDMPSDAEMEDGAAIAWRISDIVMDVVPEMDSMYFSASGSGDTALTSGGTSLTINLVPVSERDRSSAEVATALREAVQDIAGAEITVEASGTMDMSSLTGTAISVTLSGDDQDLLEETAALLADEISLLPDALDVASSASGQVPQVSLDINRENAARFGLTAATIGTAVSGQLAGTTATTLKVGGEEISVVVYGDSSSSTSLDALSAMSIPTATGGFVPLSLVADVNVEMSALSITRVDQVQQVSVTGASASGDSTLITEQIETLLKTFPVPDGVTIDMGGETAEMMESFSSLAYALLISIGLIYFVLASQFESFIMPLMVMTILPVSLLGSLVGLPISGQKISIVAFIGVIMLAGIVVNSSIVLIDYIKTRRERGEDRYTAILNACPRRVRPVLMTTATTVFGLVPMALGIGESSELMVPMAAVMIAGMILSCVVTLFFTPVYYTLIDDLTKGRRARREQADAAAVAAVGNGG